MRLFAALPLATQVVERLTQFRLRQSAPGDGLRWSESTQWHISLQFYEEAEPGQVHELAEAVRATPRVAPELRIESFGLFLQKGILFAGVVETDSLLTLFRHLQAARAICGFPPEERVFKPHVTLARMKNKAGATTLKRLTQPALPLFGAPIEWFPENLLFLESRLRPSGAEYRIVTAVPLQKGPHKDGQCSSE